MNVCLVLGWILGENENIIQVHYNEVVKQVSEDGVHESLKNCRSICESKVHNHEVKQAITSLKGSLPFVPRSDVNEVVGTPKINLGEDL